MVFSGRRCDAIQDGARIFHRGFYVGIRYVVRGGVSPVRDQVDCWGGES